MSYLKRLWHAAPVATLLLVFALAMTGVFGLRMATHSKTWRGEPSAQPVAAWMTPGFIGHAYHIPRKTVIQGLQAPVPPPDGPMTLTELADYRGVPVETVLEEARALVEEARAQAAEDRP